MQVSQTRRIGITIAVLSASVFVYFSCVALASMQDDNILKLRANTRVVQIDVTVRDSQGKPVDDLKRTDFTVTDNGKRIRSPSSASTMVRPIRLAGRL